MSVMYGFGYEVLLALLLAVVLLVGVPLSVILRRSGLGWWMILPVVAFSSLSVLVLAVIFSTVVTVRLLSDGTFAPPPEPLKSLKPRPRRAGPPLDRGCTARSLTLTRNLPAIALRT